jgi:hypothetical protein
MPEKKKKEFRDIRTSMRCYNVFAMRGLFTNEICIRIFLEISPAVRSPDEKDELVVVNVSCALFQVSTL